ncbi:Golgi phosphoprotein 3-domain-containing protein [Lyophyllum atratum]|nr:Golgi phosphoprotein 3-domain-containing protein [Lyophyllum atratum]
MSRALASRTRPRLDYQQERGRGAACSAGSAFAGGSKIAYGARDLDQDASKEARIWGKTPLSHIHDGAAFGLCWRILLVKDANRRRNPTADRLAEVTDEPEMGETILDGALRMMKTKEHGKMSVDGWIDLLGVRDHLAKGLADEGILRTRKRDFLLLDMTIHLIADVRTKESVVSRATSLLPSTTASMPPAAFDCEGTQFGVVRARVCWIMCSGVSGEEGEAQQEYGDLLSVVDGPPSLVL